MQLSLDFEAGLTARYPKLMDMVVAAVEKSHRQKQSIAGDMDLSPSDLARKLHGNENDTRRLNVRELDALIIAAGDSGKDIVYWLVERHLGDEKTRQERAADMILKLGPALMAAANELNGDAAK